MSFNLNKNSRTLSFSYNTLVVPRTYSGLIDLTNTQSCPTFFGSYEATTPTCPKEAYTAIKAWFDSPDGAVVSFPCFDHIPAGGLISGSIKWKAEVGHSSRLVLRSFKNNVAQPYLVTNAVPITTDLAFDPVTYLFLEPPGTPIVVAKFGFRIVPENTTFKYTRSGSSVTFDPIPFKAIPVSLSNLTAPVAPVIPVATVIPLVYNAANPANGLFYYLGTENGTSSTFQNPSPTKVQWLVNTQYQVSSYPPETLSDRTPNFYHGNNGTPNWIVVDLGSTRSFKATQYRLQSRAPQYNCPKSWKLQGTNSLTSFTVSDVNTANWIDLSVITNDFNLVNAGSPTFAALFPASSPTAYRYLRLIQTDLTHDGYETVNLSDIELYGDLTLT